MSEGEVARVVAGAPFDSLADFWQRAQVDRPLVERMVLAGAFDAFASPARRRDLLAGRRALYVSGEESAGQIRLRAERTGCTHDNVYLAGESDLQIALGHIDEVKPSLLIVDSVQTMSTTEADGVTVRDTYGISRAELAQRLDVTLLNC